VFTTRPWPGPSFPLDIRSSEGGEILYSRDLGADAARTEDPRMQNVTEMNAVRRELRRHARTESRGERRRRPRRGGRAWLNGRELGPGSRFPQLERSYE
jgi:hypothetical protein